MPDLPAERVCPSRAFQHIGIDYMVPLNINTSKERRQRVSKIYIALFTCFTTRAIHMELEDGLTTTALIHIFQRYMTIRGLPDTITLDNAPQFFVLS